MVAIRESMPQCYEVDSWQPSIGSDCNLPTANCKLQTANLFSFIVPSSPFILQVSPVLGLPSAFGLLP